MADDYADALRAIAHRAGLHQQHFRTLALLCDRPMRVVEIAPKLGLSYAQTARVVAELTKKRLIERDLWSVPPRPLRPTLIGRQFDARVRAVVAHIDQEDVT
jgi:hypothetical protein